MHARATSPGGHPRRRPPATGRGALPGEATPAASQAGSEGPGQGTAPRGPHCSSQGGPAPAIGHPLGHPLVLLVWLHRRSAAAAGSTQQPRVSAPSLKPALKILFASFSSPRPLFSLPFSAYKRSAAKQGLP